MQNHFQNDIGKPVFFENMLMGLYLKGKPSDNFIKHIFMGNIANDPVVERGMSGSSSNYQL